MMVVTGRSARPWSDNETSPSGRLPSEPDSRMTQTGALLLRSAEPDEVAALSRLAVRSKGVWGYSPVFLEECLAELTLAADELLRLHVVVAESPSGLAGFYSLAVQEDQAEVNHFFVEPRVIGTGVGRALWRHLITNAEEMGLLAVHIEADPNAEGSCCPGRGLSCQQHIAVRMQRR